MPLVGEQAGPAVWRSTEKPTGSAPAKGPGTTIWGLSNLPTARQRAEGIYLRLVRAQPGQRLPSRLVVTSEVQSRISVDSPDELVVSAGLVQMCTSDSQLAGVLSLALVDWIMRHSTTASPGEREPLDLRIGPESNTYGELPLLRQAELVKTGHAHRPNWPHLRAEAESTARQIYQGAGFDGTELEQARAIYRQAHRN